MFVYVWKDLAGVPFYVGFTNTIRRTNPRNSGGRNWLCRQKLAELGLENVVVEFHTVASIIEGQALERKLIAEYGRIQTGTGPLTNLSSGGDGVASPSPEHRAKLSAAMKDPNHPVRSPEARAKLRARMQSPDVRAKFIGENNPAKKEENRAKIKAKWQDPDFKAMMSAVRTGKKKNFSEAARAELATRLAANPDMKGWGERNGKDPEFDAKRIAGIRAAQDKRREKMSDPEALAQRKARLRETLNSPEYKARRAAMDTPEYRAKLSAAKKAYWEKRRAAKNISTPK